LVRYYPESEEEIKSPKYDVTIIDNITDTKEELSAFFLEDLLLPSK
jgi:hypothetical protein